MGEMILKITHSFIITATVKALEVLHNTWKGARQFTYETFYRDKMNHSKDTVLGTYRSETPFELQNQNWVLQQHV